MGLTREAPERRVDPQEQEQPQYVLDSQFRAFRMDQRGIAVNNNHGSRFKKILENDPHAELVISVAEELSRRIESLERNERILSDEIRWLNRRDQRRRSLYSSIGIVIGAILVCRWIIDWL